MCCRAVLGTVLAVSIGVFGPDVAYAQASGVLAASGMPVSNGAPIAVPAGAKPAPTDGLSDAEKSMIERGHYLATAADCAACHTAAAGRPFAGGYPIASPLGTIYSSNITPSTSGGIGDYTEQDFVRAVREGIRRDGSHLYPAMPYTSYAGLSDADMTALYAYFRHGVAADNHAPPKTSLPFPFSLRVSMAVWNAVFLHDQRFTPVAAHTAEVNRGAYLVQNLAHCAECHTPRNALMGLDTAHDLSGGAVGSWYAPNITNDPINGIGRWTDAQLLSYLKTGRAAGVAQAAGPMAEAVTNSLQYLSDSDLQSIVAYLRTTSDGSAHSKPSVDDTTGTSATAAATGAAATAGRAGFGSAHSAEAETRGILADSTNGAQLYSGNCAACHRADGSGSPDGDYPALFGNTATGASNANNLISTILFGVDRTVNGKHVLMPAFGPHGYVNALSDQEVADLSNYVLTRYGNAKVKVTAEDVAVVAQGGPVPLIATLGHYAVPLTIVVALIVLLVVALVVRRLGRRRRALR
jgi:mono/diheme cytochrome c family protein